MTKRARFKDLKEVRSERERLKALRDHHQNELLGYWRLLHEPDFRRALAGDAFGDMLRAWRPMRTLGTMFTMGQGSAGTTLGLLLGSRSRTFKGRIIGWIVGLLAPKILERYATPEKLEHLMNEIRRSWGRVRDRMQQAGPTDDH